MYGRIPKDENWREDSRGFKRKLTRGSRGNLMKFDQGVPEDPAENWCEDPQGFLLKIEERILDDLSEIRQKDPQGFSGGSNHMAIIRKHLKT
jgi:hypothetical protein